MSGHVGNLSPKQEQTLTKFREKVQDVLQPDQGDHFLLRWLRARDFDLKKAEVMLRDAAAWRQQMGAYTIVDDYKPIEVLEKYRTGGIIGKDKTGCPIFIDPYGLIDMKGLMHCVKNRDIMRWFVHKCETVRVMVEEESKKRNREIEEVIVIYDLAKVGTRHMWPPGVEMYLKIVEVCESRYPESLKHVFVINAPKIFPVMWHIVKPFLHEATAKKVRVLSDNYKTALLKVMDAECLPVCYGGTKVDENGDPRCSALICQGGIVPKEYYCQSTPTVSMTTVTVGRGSSLQLVYDIKLQNCILRWEYQSEDHDIAFGIFMKTVSGPQKICDMKVLITPQRSNCQMVPADGILECKEPGTYVVQFDNSYSWARSKKLHYVIEVLEPENNPAIDDDDEFFEAEEDTL